MTRRRDDRFFALAIVVVCLLAGASLAWIARATPAHTVTTTAAGPSPLTMRAASAPTTTSTVPELPAETPPAPTPTPAPAPANGGRVAAPAVDLNPIGTIEIPKIGLVHPVFEGNTLTSIDKGPSHWPGTAMPGQRGNAVFAGHRVTHTHPFLHIDELVPGDLVFFTIGNVRTTYRVTDHQVVTPKDTWIVDQTPNATATLFGCHPPHSARYRYVVRLELVTQ